MTNCSTFVDLVDQQMLSRVSPGNCGAASVRQWWRGGEGGNECLVLSTEVIN